MRGFKLGKKLVQLWRRPPGYTRLVHSDQNRRRCSSKTMGAAICDWGRRLRSRLLRCSVPTTAAEYPKVEAAAVPKGHLAVYVGRKECGGGNRHLVPVIYFNHPLFGELLRDAEEEFGFQHPGGITIPCPEAEFECVRMKIAAAAAGGPIARKLSRRRLFLTGKGRKEF